MSLALSACTSVDATEWCVQTRYGKVVNKHMDIGINGSFTVSETCFPMTDRVFPSDTTESVTAQTRDPLTVTGDVSIVYSYDPVTLFDSVFMTKRSDDAAELEILNAIREGYRNAISEWTVQDIIDRRNVISDSVRVAIQRKLGGRAIVKRAYVRAIHFPKVIEDSRIIAVTRASQLDAARKKLAIDSANATSVVIEAESRARAKRLEAESYTSSPKLLDLEIAKYTSNICSHSATCILGGSVADKFFAK